MINFSYLLLLGLVAGGTMGVQIRTRRQSGNENQDKIVWGTVEEFPEEQLIDTLPVGIQLCIRKCPVTSEYNPVCGTDMVRYDNPGKLICAQMCGVNVKQLKWGNCPSATTSSRI